MEEEAGVHPRGTANMQMTRKAKIVFLKSNPVLSKIFTD
jgi:hypothetical protein